MGWMDEQMVIKKDRPLKDGKIKWVDRGWVERGMDT